MKKKNMILGLMLWAGICNAQTPDVHAILNTLRASYSDTVSLTTDFDLTIYWAIREKTDHKTGTIYCAPGNRFRVDLGKVSWIGNGTDCWQKRITDGRIDLQKLDNIDNSTSPSTIYRRYLAGSDWKLVKTIGDTAVLALSADSAGILKKGETVQLRVVVSKARIGSLIITDKNKNVSTYVFSRTRIGTTCPDSLFSVPDSPEVPKK